MMDNDFNFKQVPYYWSLCCLSECERKEECMRYQVCQLMPERMTDHPCVLPSVLKKKECPRFHPIKKVRAAYGFRFIFLKVLAKDITEIRSRIARYLGSQATFFRYQRGDYPLMPRQQEWIQKLFRQYGYTEELSFDRYRDIYQFTD